MVAAYGGEALSGSAPPRRLILVQNFFEELRRLTGTE